MSSITAAPNDATGSVDLNIIKTADVLKVVRMNVNGVEEVRASTGQMPSTGAGTLILTDYEAAHGLNTYNMYMGPEVRTNLVQNPSFENTITGWTATGATLYAYSIASQLSNWTAAGAGPAGNYLLRTTTNNTVDASVITYGAKVPVTPGKYIGVSAAGSVNSSGIRWRVGYAFYDAAGTWISEGYSVSSVSASVYNLQTLMTSAQVPSNAATVAPRFRVVMADGTMTIPANTVANMYNDRVMVVQAPTKSEAEADALKYFDGDTAPTTDASFAWAGTPHDSTSTSTTNNVMVTASATLNVDKPWLSVPVMPQYSEQVDTITQFGASRETATTVHRPLGRADSLVVMGKLGDRTGSLEIFCNSYEDARRLERVFERGEIVQLRQRVEGLDMYFTATSIPVSPYAVQGESSTRWSMTINYVEVRRPIGDLAGALGWTFDEMASSAVSFDVISRSYLTFDALTLGDANV